MSKPDPLKSNTLRNGPDERGHFGIYGGQFVAETLMPLIHEVAHAFEAASIDPEFAREKHYYLTQYVGRPSPLYFAERLTNALGGAKVYLKRERHRTPSAQCVSHEDAGC